MSESSKKIILTEKLVNKVFHSGLRLSINSSNTNPHKEVLLKLVPEETPSNKKKDLYIEKVEERVNKKEENEKKNLNRFNNEKNTNKVKTDIFFKQTSNLTSSQEEQCPTIKKERISKKAIGEFVKKDSSLLCFNQEEIETENDKRRILVPSKSQIIKINHLIGSNPVNFLGKKEMNAYVKANQIDKSKQVASMNIRSSNGMKSVLQSENEENGSSIKKSQALNQKVNYFSSSILKDFSKEADKKKEIKTFRHVYDRNMKVTGYRD